MIASFWVDAEAARFAHQLKDVITHSGLGSGKKVIWNATVDDIGQYPQIITGVFGGSGAPVMRIVVGVQVWGADRELVRTFATLMRSTRLGDVIVGPWPTRDGFADLFSKMPLSVFVGTKPIPETE